MNKSTINFNEEDDVSVCILDAEILENFTYEYGTLNKQGMSNEYAEI